MQKGCEDQHEEGLASLEEAFALTHSLSLNIEIGTIILLL